MSDAIVLDRVRMSAEVGDLFKALAEAQKAMANVGYDAKNPHFRSRYATLAAVRDAVLPHTSSAGLGVLQFPYSDHEGAGVVTMVGHASGQWIAGDLRVPLAKRDPQTVGSAVTYARRYSLQAVACIAPDDDDDAEAAMARGHEANNVVPMQHPRVAEFLDRIRSAGTAQELADITADVRAAGLQGEDRRKVGQAFTDKQRAL